ncbi:30S ribosomal protein S11 [Candidatus Pacearchaeota archaeon]|nr:30S ribosomal protein S11 [Candidatus Pacearchaeota archaeon]
MVKADKEKSKKIKNENPKEETEEIVLKEETLGADEIAKEDPGETSEENEPSEKASKKAAASKEFEAVVNIYTSFNNTIVHVTDMSGKTISKVTGGMITKHDRLKANPTIAMFISKRIAEEVKDLGIKSFYVRIRAKTRNPAPGPGAHSIIKSLTRDGFKILNILDTTRIPRGGPKVKGGRRGRRP